MCDSVAPLRHSPTATQSLAPPPRHSPRGGSPRRARPPGLPDAFQSTWLVSSEAHRSENLSQLSCELLAALNVPLLSVFAWAMDTTSVNQAIVRPPEWKHARFIYCE